MKRYLTTIFIILSVVILLIGLQINAAWSSVASWGLSFISLIFAVYYTKYIPNEKNEKSSREES